MESERCYSVSQTNKTQLPYSKPKHSDLWGQKRFLPASAMKEFVSDFLVCSGQQYFSGLFSGSCYKVILPSIQPSVSSSVCPPTSAAVSLMEKYFII